MPLSQPFYNLKNLACVLADGKGSGLISLKIKRNPVYSDPKWPGQSLVPSQAYVGESFPDITAEFYADENVNFASVAPNTAIESFELTSPSDNDESYLGDLLTRFPIEGWVFGEMDTTLVGDKLSTITIPIKTNVMNPGPDGGFA